MSGEYHSIYFANRKVSVFFSPSYISPSNPHPQSSSKRWLCFLKEAFRGCSANWCGFLPTPAPLECGGRRKKDPFKRSFPHFFGEHLNALRQLFVLANSSKREDNRCFLGGNAQKYQKKLIELPLAN